jgi:hypothetical protein
MTRREIDIWEICPEMHDAYRETTSLCGAPITVVDQRPAFVVYHNREAWDRFSTMAAAEWFVRQQYAGLSRKFRIIHLPPFVAD